MTFRVEPSLDGTRVYASRPATGKFAHGLVGSGLVTGIWLAILGFATLGTDWHVYWSYLWFPLAMAAVAAVVAGLLAMPLQPSDTYEILLDRQGVAIDGERMGLDVNMVLHAEKLVFRDSQRQDDVWHGIRDLDERMKLREVLERALADAHDRHGAGAQHVPAALRERPSQT